MGSVCNKATSVSKRNTYKDFHHTLPPKPTNECDRRYLDKKGELATLGLGCYWAAQAAFDGTPGVIRTRVGLSDGAHEYLILRKVLTRPCEVVEIEYDAEQISFEELIRIFFHIHKPWEVPESDKYRSVIFYHTAKQKEEAKRVLHEEQKKYSGNKEKFHTKIVPAGDVVIAQRDQQHYFLMKQDENLLKSAGIYEMDEDQFTYSHLMSRMNGYVSGHGNLQQFETEKSDLQLDPISEILLTQILTC